MGMTAGGVKDGSQNASVSMFFHHSSYLANNKLATRSRIFTPAKTEDTLVHHSFHNHGQLGCITQTTYAQYP